jgi:hypothetical protein
MGILTLLQHKEAAVVEPPAKNASIFVAESTEGAGENEVLAERPAFRVGASFLRFIMGDSRRLLGVTAAEAAKTVTEAEGVTGIEPSATKAALVTVSFIAKAEATAFNVEANGLVVYEQKSTPLVGDIVPMGTYLVQPGKKIKVTKVTGAVSNVKFSVQLMN